MNGAGIVPLVHPRTSRDGELWRTEAAGYQAPDGTNRTRTEHREHISVRYSNLFSLKYRRLSVSGRQDLNLRPPGPQPEGWSIAQAMEPVFTGFCASEFAWVSLNLFPKLFPKRMFAWVSPTPRSASTLHIQDMR